jgi:hypothetical protein
MCHRRVGSAKQTGGLNGLCTPYQFCEVRKQPRTRCSQRRRACYRSVRIKGGVARKYDDGIVEQKKFRFLVCVLPSVGKHIFGISPSQDS